MKKILSIILALLMIASLSTAVFAAETEVPYDSSWVVTASSVNAPGVDILKAFDGDTATYWHTKYTVADGQITGHDECPHMITIVFPSEKTISGWKYTPRTDNGTGTVLAYNIYASTDGTKYEKIYTGTFDYKAGADVVRETEGASWGNVKMKAMKIEVTESLGGYGTATEIKLYTGGSGNTNASGTLVEKTTSSESGASKTESSQAVSGTAIPYEASWKVTVSSDFGNTISRAFDGDIATHWHSKYTVEDGQITSHDECPHTITVVFPTEKTVSGWLYTPRTDNGTGTILAYNIYASTDGSTYEKIYTGTFDYKSGGAGGRPPEGASWGDKKMKAIKIEATETLGGYGTAAEINFYTGGSGNTNASGTLKEDKSESTVSGRTASDGTPLLDKTGWKAEVNSQMGTSVNTIFDKNVNTFWHSAYVAEGPTIVSHDNPPYHLKVTLPKEATISGIVLTPREDNSNGRIMGADVYVSDSDDGEYFLLKEGLEFSNSSSAKEIEFTANIKVKRVWIEITSSNGGYGTLAEFDLMKEKEDFETVSYKDYAANEEKNQLYQIDRKNLTAEYDGENWAGNTPINLFDDSEQTFWQTDGIMNSDWPAVLTVDLKSVYRVKEIRYTPRQSGDHHGCWLNVTISGSTDGENWQVLKENLELPEDLLLKKITLDSEAEVRYIEFQINKAFGGRAGGAELSFYQSKAAKDAYDAANKGKFILKIGSNVIESIKGGVTKNTEIDVSPYIINGSTMIPLRGLLEEMGATVTWNGDEEKITVQNGANTIRLQIWNYLVYVDGTAYGDLRYTLLNPPIIKDSRTFIPIRFVSEQLGYNVSWDAETQTVTIEK